MQASNNTRDDKVSQMDKLLQRCLFTLTNAHNPNQYKWGQQSLDITLWTISFLGLWFSIALVHAFITWIFIIVASCIHVCLETLFFMNNFFTRYSFQYTSKPISLGLPCIHVCLKTLLFMNGRFYKIFISFPNTLYWWQCYLFQV